MTIAKWLCENGRVNTVKLNIYTSSKLMSIWCKHCINELQFTAFSFHSISFASSKIFGAHFHIADFVSVWLRIKKLRRFSSEKPAHFTSKNHNPGNLSFAIFHFVAHWFACKMIMSFAIGERKTRTKQRKKSNEEIMLPNIFRCCLKNYEH